MDRVGDESGAAIGMRSCGKVLARMVGLRCCKAGGVTMRRVHCDWLGMRALMPAMAVVMLACAGGTGPGDGAGPKVPSTPSELAVEAYVYAYPLLVFDLERKAQFQALGVSNQLSTRTTTSTPFSHDVLEPNADTVSTTALLDLRSGPLVLSVPDSGNRYTRIDLLDAYTNVFASLGQRTEGNKAASFAIVGPGGPGAIAGVTTVRSPTNYVWLHGQVAAQGERDVPIASGLMRQWSLTPLAEFAAGKRRLAAVRPSVADTDGGAAKSVEALKPAKYFEEAARLLQINPPAPADGPLVKKFASIGLDYKSGRFNPGKLKSETLAKAVNDGRARIHGAKTVAASQNGWSFEASGGNYGVDYLSRAAAARTGIGGALPQDGVEATARLSGGSRSVLHFAKGDLPPVNAFWSLTMLDDNGRMVDNMLNRYAVRSDRLTKDADGGITVYLQAPPPDESKRSNWLPAPKGSFQLLLRLYWPKEEAINGTWKPPAVK